MTKEDRQEEEEESYRGMLLERGKKRGAERER